MKARKYKTADVATNFTDIKVKLQKRDVFKIAAVVFVVETLLHTRVSEKTQRQIRDLTDRLVDRVDEALDQSKEKEGDTKWGDASTDAGS